MRCKSPTFRRLLQRFRNTRNIRNKRFSYGVTKELEDNGKIPRMAFTMKETADILGVSYITVHRLIQRRLLRSSLASRKKIYRKDRN